MNAFALFLATFQLALALALFGVVSIAVDLGCALLERGTDK